MHEKHVVLPIAMFTTVIDNVQCRQDIAAAPVCQQCLHGALQSDHRCRHSNETSLRRRPNRHFTGSLSGYQHVRDLVKFTYQKFPELADRFSQHVHGRRKPDLLRTVFVYH